MAVYFDTMQRIWEPLLGAQDAVYVALILRLYNHYLCWTIEIYLTTENFNYTFSLYAKYKN